MCVAHTHSSQHHVCAKINTSFFPRCYKPVHYSVSTDLWSLWCYCDRTNWSM